MKRGRMSLERCDGEVVKLGRTKIRKWKKKKGTVSNAHYTKNDCYPNQKMLIENITFLQYYAH
jgi:hypothetical protein